MKNNYTREDDFKQRTKYMQQLQKTFRHSEVPTYLLLTLQNVPQFNSAFIEFYRVSGWGEN